MIEKERYDYVAGSTAIKPKPILEPYVEEIAKKQKKVSKVKVINKKHQKRIIASLLLLFSLLMFIVVRGNSINEKNLRVNTLKNDLKKQNDQIVALQLQLEKSNDLNMVEQYAKEKLGMQKPQPNQLVYIDLGVQDHIAKTEDVITEKNSVLKSVKEYIANIVKIVE